MWEEGNERRVDGRKGQNERTGLRDGRVKKACMAVNGHGHGVCGGRGMWRGVGGEGSLVRDIGLKRVAVFVLATEGADDLPSPRRGIRRSARGCGGGFGADCTPV